MREAGALELGDALFDDGVPPVVGLRFSQPASPHGRYAVVDDATGRWEVEFRSVDYFWERAARVAECNGRRSSEGGCC